MQTHEVDTVLVEAEAVAVLVEDVAALAVKEVILLVEVVGVVEVERGSLGDQFLLFQAGLADVEDFAVFEPF